MTGIEPQDHAIDDTVDAVVARMAVEGFSGQVDIGTPVHLRLFFIDGSLYFAERGDDATLGSRFVGMGALTPAQLARGGTHADGVVGLAHLFERDPSIDRDKVEDALRRLRNQVVADSGREPAGDVHVLPLQHHPSGIHHWFADSVDAGPRADAPALPTLGGVGSWKGRTDGEELNSAEHRFAPADLDGMQLPKLSSRPMSMAEITTAHAVIAADTPAPVEPAPVEAAPAPLVLGTPLPPPSFPAPAPDAAVAPVHAPPAPLDIPAFEVLIDSPEVGWVPPPTPVVDEIWAMVDAMGDSVSDDATVDDDGGDTAGGSANDPDRELVGAGTAESLGRRRRGKRG